MSASSEASRDISASAHGRYVLYLATATISALVYVVASKFLIDDTYITLSYARNLALNGEWALVSGYESNTATSPLNVLAIAALTFIVRDAVLACGILFVITAVLLVAAFRRIAILLSISTAFAPTAAALIVINPVFSSSIGLEVLMGTAALAWVALFAAENRAIALGIVVGLAVVIRIDLVVVAAVLVLLRPNSLGRIWLSALASVAIALPWFLVSWLWLGSALPDTVVIKTGQGAWGEYAFGNGLLMYLDVYPAATVLIAAVPVLGAICLVGSIFVRAWRRNVVLCAWGIGGVVYYVAYTFLEVPPYHWYYGVPVAAGTVVMVGAVFASPFPLRILGCVVAVVAAVASVWVWWWSVQSNSVVPITTNHASADQYRVIGAQIAGASGGLPVRSGGEIGAIAYYCDCVIVDKFSDRGLLLPDLEKREAGTGVTGWLWRLNFRNLDSEELRGRGPISLEYQLLRLGPDEQIPPSIAQWPVMSPWTGDDDLFLVDVELPVPN